MERSGTPPHRVSNAVPRGPTERKPVAGTLDDRLRGVLHRLAPGTPLREGIDRVIKSGKGALIVLGASDAVQPLLSGGFKMQTKFTAQRLSELAKMDGAIVVDDDVERILHANVHLVPDPSISTAETGTRHRTAERTAKQTGVPVVSVSESMQIVSLYLDDHKHIFEEPSSLLFRGNQALSTLEKYRVRLDEVSASLSALEIENVVTLRDVLVVLQRAEMVRRISDEIGAYVLELGTDGRLLQLQHNELMARVDDERELVVRDYIVDRRHKLDKVLMGLDELDAQELLDLSILGELLGYDLNGDEMDRAVAPRGYRLLSRIPRLPESIVDKLVRRFRSLQRLMEASLEELDEVEGVGATRARAIKEGLARLAESSILERYA
jgi:diadenylate cyclase